jgi:hypothetical protein
MLRCAENCCRVETTNVKIHATGLDSVDPVRDQEPEVVHAASPRLRICLALLTLPHVAALVVKSSRARRMPVSSGATKKSVEM